MIVDVFGHELESQILAYDLVGLAWNGKERHTDPLERAHGREEARRDELHAFARSLATLDRTCEQARVLHRLGEALQHRQRLAKHRRYSHFEQILF